MFDSTKRFLRVLLIAIVTASVANADETAAHLFMTDPALAEQELKKVPRIPRRAALATAALPAAEGGSVCEAVLQHAAGVYASEYSIDDQKSWTYAKVCGSSSTSSNLAVDIVVENLPIGLSAGKSGREQWCNENSAYKSRLEGYRKIENQVMATAIQNWGQCIEAAAHNLHTRVNVSVTDRVFQFKIKNGTDTTRAITEIRALSDEDAGLSCDKNPPPALAIRPNEVITFNCTRSFVEVSRGGEKYQVLPGGTITIANSINPYFYSFRERFKNDSAPEGQPEKFLMTLDGAHIGTKAYWAGGRSHSLQYCPGERLDAIRPGFELVAIGTYEKRAWGRGQCAGAPFCDSHNEFCNELYYSKGCYVSTKWHDWFKNEMAKNGLAYTKEAACAVP